MDGSRVTWAEGAQGHVDAVILATEYRPELSCLDSSGALDGNGLPHQKRGVSTTLSGLGCDAR